MGRQDCHKEYHETGNWFQIECVREDIISKEAKGQDASFERSLLKAWSKYPGWEGAKEALSTLV